MGLELDGEGGGEISSIEGGGFREEYEVGLGFVVVVVGGGEEGVLPFVEGEGGVGDSSSESAG